MNFSINSIFIMMNQFKILIKYSYKNLLCLIFMLAYTFGWGQVLDEKDDQIKGIIEELTIEEKVSLFHGFISDSIPKRFESGGIERMAIPTIKMLDGPVGLRDFQEDQPTTALPSTLLLSCTWDTLVVKKYAKVLAQEMLALDKQVLYGPGINLMRSPLGGRNFEYMGEDPLLTANLATVYINELQKHDIAACAKHFVANDIDHLRHFVSSDLDERTLREIHLYPFERVIREANVWSIMVGNNLVNGKHMAENNLLINKVLREELDFDGVIISDWRAAYEAIASFEGGLDMSMGFCAYVYGEGNLLDLVNKGQIKETELDEHLSYILKLYQRTGLLQKDKKYKPKNINTAEHKNIAMDVAAEGMVLLKNEESFLPLVPSEIKKIIVSGPAANKVAFGKGSSRVDPEISFTPLVGLKDLYQQNKIILIEDIDVVDSKILTEYASKNYPVLYFAEGPASGEGHDLFDIDLTNDQTGEIKKWGEKFSTGVVVQSASAFNTVEWSKSAKAILSAWYSGQATGKAIAKVISGDVNPSGKLSFTMANNLNDYAPHALGVWTPKSVVDPPPLKASFIAEERFALHGYSTDYEEGILHGYRWFDNKGIEPAYEFGFGLSYTSFSLSNVDLEVVSSNVDNPELIIKGEIKNTGDMAGAEVIQIYVGDIKSSVLRPQKELKAFTKIFLEPNQSKRFSIHLGKEAFQFWDEQNEEWKVEKGKFLISTGTSSRTIHSQDWLEL